MTQAQDNFGKYANALEALASGKDLAPQQDAAPADPMEHVTAVTPQQQALDSLAAGKPAAGDALGELAGLSAGGDGVSSGFPAAAAQAAAFPRPVRRSTRAAAAMRMVHSHQYKKVMVPILAVVGCLLVASALYTIGVLATTTTTTTTDDPTAMPAEETYFSQYGLLFVLVSLPMGAILLLGSWLFHAESKKR